MSGSRYTCSLFHDLTRSFYARGSQKRKNIQLSHQYLFTLLESTRVKAVHKALMKFSPAVNFTIILPVVFVPIYSLANKLLSQISCAKQFGTKKMFLKC